LHPNDQPIGIFDSGIGGLTVAHEVSSLLPNESFVYFGDTAHMPYGDKSIELIRSYSKGIVDFLVHHHQCKAIVIACNTASAAAYTTLRDELKGAVPVINVIDPMIEKVINNDNISSVGIIATKTTILSGVYQEKFKRRKPSLELHPLATPLLAPMIEEGLHHNQVSSVLLDEYLNNPELTNIDALILACTHYPLIKDEINAFYQGRIKILDSAIVVAQKLKGILTNENMLAQRDTAGKGIFYVSDYTEGFVHAAKLFYGSSINLKPIILNEH